MDDQGDASGQGDVDAQGDASDQEEGPDNAGNEQQGEIEAAGHQNVAPPPAIEEYPCDACNRTYKTTEGLRQHKNSQYVPHNIISLLAARLTDAIPPAPTSMLVPNAVYVSRLRHF